MRAFRVAVLAAVVGAVSVAMFPAFLTLRSMGTKVFEPETFDFALLGASTFAIALGARVVPWRAAPYIAVVALLASGSLLFAFLAAFSIGLVFLLPGVACLLLLYRALRRAPRGATPTLAALGGAAIGFGLPLLYIALIVPATVECSPSGGGTSSGRWNPPSRVMTSMGSVSADGQGVFTGWMEYDGTVVTYRCEGGRVVDFQRTSR